MFSTILYTIRFSLGIGIISIFLICFISIKDTYAQSVPTQQGTVSLNMRPAYPEPNTEVTLSLDDYSVKTLGADIIWYVNGLEKVSNRNNRSLTLTTGSLGEKITVVVTLVRNNIPISSAERIIIPSVVDIILESNTYIPNFYRGRALPSSESTVRAIAIFHDGTNTSWDNNSYKWTLGETVLSGGPLKGKYVMDVVVPRLQSKQLTVEVYNARGGLVGKKSIFIDSVQPQLHLYEYSPLHGLSERAIQSPLALTSPQTTLYAEPFFLNTQILDTIDTRFVWKLNNVTVPTDESAPNAIELTKNGSAGEASVSVAITTLKKIPQYVADTIDVVFQ